MIILGLILLVVGYFTFRPLAFAGAVLTLIGVILLLAHVASPYGTYWY